MRTATIPAEKAIRVREQPAPYSNLTPTVYASSLADQFAATASSERRRDHGQFFTPADLARFMGALARPGTAVRRLLDPGAGSGILACALCESLPPGAGPIHLDAYEVDHALAKLCGESLRLTQGWLENRGIAMTFRVHETDFVLQYGAVLGTTPDLFSRRCLPEPYDIAISNPPYFKLPKQDPRAVAAAAVVYGQPNIYALFMAITASLLAPGGVMVTITPRSFTTGDYFRRFRQHLFGLLIPEEVHLFGSRRDAFRTDDVLQENVILRGRRTAPTPAAKVAISTSAGITDLPHRRVRRVPLSAVVDLRSREVVFHIPTGDLDDAVIGFVRSWPNTLHRLGLEVSTGPVVAFRATQFLCTNPGKKPAAPLLWLKHVQPFSVRWPVPQSTKPQYILDNEDSRGLLLPNATYVVLRRFSAKEERRRLTAAPLFRDAVPGPRVGLENHLNYIHRPKGEIHPNEAAGLAALLGSSLLDRYFRVSNGNTQVNAAELRVLPLPEEDRIRAIGVAAHEAGWAPAGIDAAVAKLLDVPADLLDRLHPESYAEEG